MPASSDRARGGGGPSTPRSRLLLTTTTTDSEQSSSSRAKQLLSPSKRLLPRGPSLSQLVETLRLYKPDKWRAMDDSTDQSTQSVDTLLPTLAVSASDDVDRSDDDGGKLPLAAAASHSEPLMASSTVDCDSKSDSGQADMAAPAGPRLRLTARLAAAPLLARSKSTGSVPGIAAAAAHGSAANATASAKADLGRRPSARAPLPSLEAIEKRFMARSKLQQQQQQPQVGKASPGSGTSTEDRVQVAAAPMSREGSRVSSDSASSSVAGSASDTSMDSLVSEISAATSVSAAPAADANSKSSGGAGPGHLDLSSHSTSTAILRGKPPIASPNTPTDVSSSSSAGLDRPRGASNARTAALSNPGLPLPLENSWTLYFDSKATAAAAKAKPKSGGNSSKDVNSWEASLSTIGTLNTVQSFCRLFNWLKKPSKMGQSENLHFFKNGIKPMWEDPSNCHGGKWTLNIAATDREFVDKAWLWLCLGLIGEQFGGHEDAICGAVVSTRPRLFRIQVWIRNKDNVHQVNAIGKHIIHLLELDNSDEATPTAAAPHRPASFTRAASSPNVSLEFGYHSKSHIPHGKFVSFGSGSLPPSSASISGPGSAGGPNGNSSGTSSIAGGTGGTNSNSSPASLFNKPGHFGGTVSSGSIRPVMNRSATVSTLPTLSEAETVKSPDATTALSAISASHSSSNVVPNAQQYGHKKVSSAGKVVGSSSGGGSASGMSWRERLGSVSTGSGQASAVSRGITPERKKSTS